MSEVERRCRELHAQFKRGEITLEALNKELGALGKLPDLSLFVFKGKIKDLLPAIEQRKSIRKGEEVPVG